MLSSAEGRTRAVWGRGRERERGQPEALVDHRPVFGNVLPDFVTLDAREHGGERERRAQTEHQHEVQEEPEVVRAIPPSRADTKE